MSKPPIKAFKDLPVALDKNQRLGLAPYYQQQMAPVTEQEKTHYCHLLNCLSQFFPSYVAQFALFADS
jgi:hypothetical protein